MEVSGNIIKANFAATAVATMCMFMFAESGYSRIMIFLTIAIVTFFELVIYNSWASLKNAKVIPDDVLGLQDVEAKRVKKRVDKERIDAAQQQLMKDAILSDYSPKVLAFLEKSVNIYSHKTLVLYSEKQFNIVHQPIGVFHNVVNLARVNNFRFINKFFEAVNSKIPIGGIFVCMAETQEQRKKRIMHKYPPVLNSIYYFFDFMIKRVLPKFRLTKRMYFFLTRGENRVISLAELLGRLYSCGYSVEQTEEIDGVTFVVAQKMREPYFDMEPTYGPLIRLVRVGKNGKLIKVFKFRTMHPYSEYLQEYVYSKYNLQDGGKFNNDFRVSTLGKFMRKFWIDELPMFINFFRGELKIVGIRPLSRHYFSLYTKDLQERRINYKPGLAPPFYVDNPKTLEEVMASEIKYLDAYDRSPVLTDIRYFFLVFYNIVFRKLRSK